MHGQQDKKVIAGGDAAKHHVSYHQDGNNLMIGKCVGGLLQLSTWPVGGQGSCVEGLQESCFHATTEPYKVGGHDCVEATVETFDLSSVVQIRSSY